MGCKTKRKKRRLLPIFMLALLLAYASGCGRRVVFTEPGDVVRFREATPAKVWVYTRGGEMKSATMTIPEGWYALPLPPAAVPEEIGECMGPECKVQPGGNR